MAMIESESRTLNGPLGGCMVGSVLCCFFCRSLPDLAARSSDPGGSRCGEASSTGGLFLKLQPRGVPRRTRTLYVLSLYIDRYPISNVEVYP